MMTNIFDFGVQKKSRCFKCVKDQSAFPLGGSGWEIGFCLVSIVMKQVGESLILWYLSTLSLKWINLLFNLCLIHPSIHSQKFPSNTYKPLCL